MRCTMRVKPMLRRTISCRGERIVLSRGMGRSKRSRGSRLRREDHGGHSRENRWQSLNVKRRTVSMRTDIYYTNRAIVTSYRRKRHRHRCLQGPSSSHRDPQPVLSEVSGIGDPLGIELTFSVPGLSGLNTIFGWNIRSKTAFQSVIPRHSIPSESHAS